MTVHAIYLTTTNDTNGNPRRGWLFMQDDDLVFFETEGYEGAARVLSHRGQYLRQAMDIAPEVKVGPGEYRRIVKQYR